MAISNINVKQALVSQLQITQALVCGSADVASSRTENIIFPNFYYDWRCGNGGRVFGA